MKKHNFRELSIWKDSMSFVKKVHLISANLPTEERFGFVSQINRSSVSIPTNIAEGSGRTTNKEFVRFLDIAISSSYELETELILINDLFDLDTSEQIMELTSLQNKIGAFIRKLKNDMDNESKKS
jgi:four helix bundle protein